MLITLAAGAFIGLINGLLITRLKVAPFIATLGMLYVARGTALLISDGSPFRTWSEIRTSAIPGFRSWGRAQYWACRLQSWRSSSSVVAAYVAARTPFGRHVYAVGGNERAAALSACKSTA